jgi:hypothetical protein
MAINGADLVAQAGTRAGSWRCGDLQRRQCPVGLATARAIRLRTG